MMCDGVTDGAIARVMGLPLPAVIAMRCGSGGLARQRAYEKRKAKGKAERFAALHTAWEKRRAEG